MFERVMDCYYLATKSCMPQKIGGLEELCVGMQGVLITTGDQEKLCVSEAYSLLNEVQGTGFWWAEKRCL